jgi:hypothetical protein
LNRSNFQTAVLATLAVGVVWTGSRAGILAGGILLMMAIISRLLKLGQLIRATLFAGLIWMVFWLVAIFASLEDVEHVAVQSLFSGEISNVERWETWVYAIELWLGSPIWGGGLGAFMANSTQWFGKPQVIHSTPLWFLAEFGIMGITIVIWSLYQFLAYAAPAIFRPAGPPRAALLFLLLVFSVFSLFHEIFFQRIIWLMLGALLAFPSAFTKAGGSHER